MAPSRFGRGGGPVPNRCAYGPDPVFDGHLFGAYMDFLQLDAPNNRYGHYPIWFDWHDMGALYLGYPNVDVHCDRPFGDDGDYYQRLDRFDHHN